MSNERIKKEGRIELVFLKVCHLSKITFNNKRIVNQTLKQKQGTTTVIVLVKVNMVVVNVRW